MADKPLIFISHYSGEKQIALALQKTLANGFLNMISVFVSSDEESIPMGADFPVTISEALRSTIYGLLVLSPISLARSWVNIEFGAMWILDKPTVPICHSGLSVGDLPSPYDNRNGMKADDTAALNKLVRNITKKLALI